MHAFMFIYLFKFKSVYHANVCYEYAHVVWKKFILDPKLINVKVINIASDKKNTVTLMRLREYLSTIGCKKTRIIHF